MRIAFVVYGFPVVSETFVLSQITGAIDRGHDVHIYTCDRSREGNTVARAQLEKYELEPRIRYLEVPNGLRERAVLGVRTLGEAHRDPRLCARSLNVGRYGRMSVSLRLLLSARVFLRHGRQRYDVIHCQFGPLGNIALRLRQIGAWDGALITAFRGYDATSLLKRSPRLYADLFREGDMFLPVSRALQRELTAHGCPVTKLDVHHSGIDCARLQYRARTLAPGEPLKLLSIARLVEKKGIDVAIEAVARLTRAGCNVRYDVIGDGEQRAALAQRITRLGMTQHVRLLGWRNHDETLVALDGAHLLIAPSVTAADGDQEGIPNALKEAMALGLPVVATRHGGNAELVEDRVSGLLVPERDDAALAQAVSRLAGDAAYWPAMGLAGRHKIETEFEQQRLNAALDDLYRRAMEAHDRGSRGRLMRREASGTVHNGT